MCAHQAYRILSWNIKGYRETIDGLRTNKLREQQIIDKLVKYDFICMQETHLDKDNCRDVSIPGFVPVHYCRKRRARAQKASGGISIYVRDAIKQHVKFIPENNSDTAWFKISHRTEETVYVGCIYAPPEYSTFGRDHCAAIWERLEAELQEYSNKGQVIICGDFNARTGLLMDYITNDSESENRYTLPECYTIDNVHARRSMDALVQKNGRKLVDACLDNNLCILNGRTIGDLQGHFTCITPLGASVVDYFICSNTLLKDVHSMTVHALSKYSDHCPLELCIYLPVCTKNKAEGSFSLHSTGTTNCIKTKPPVTAAVSYIWTEESAKRFQAALNIAPVQTSIFNLQQKLSNTTSTCSQNTDDINTRVEELTNILRSAADISLTCRTKKANTKKRRCNKRWFDNECDKQRKEVRSLLNALNRDPFNRGVREKYFAQRKKYNSQLRKKKLTYKTSLVTMLNEAMDKDPSSVWKLIKQLKDSESAHNRNQTQVSGAKWIAHLEKLLGQNTEIDGTRDSIMKEKIAQQTHQTNLLDFPITATEIEKAARNIKLKKSPGIDGITNEMIKTSLPVLRPIIQQLFNQLIQYGTYPEQWKKGVNVPIFKNGDPHNTSNYRGVTLNNTMANFFCQVINNRITNFLENNSLLAKEQAGFRKSSRTQDQVFILKKLVNDTLRTTNGRLYGCFIDFAKAFDSIWHTGLLYKMQEIGIGGKLLQVVQEMYNNATVCSKTEVGLSREITVRKGVLQGNTLSPTLFNIFINDIVDSLKDCDSPTVDEAGLVPVPCLMYADDIVILSTTKKGLQDKLNSLHEYCNKWGLQINREKTKVIVFSKHEPILPLFFKIGDAIINTTDNYKYLGIIFNKRGDMKMAQNHLSRQGSKALHSLKRAVRTKNISVPVMAKLFDTLVAPILTFGSEIWLPYCKDINLKDTQNLENNLLEKCITTVLPHENVHMKFCKQLLGVHRKSMNFPVLAELGRFPISTKILGQIISFWLHIMESDQHGLLRQTYSSLLSQEHKEENKWLLFVREFLTSSGFKHVWQNQSTIHPARLKHALTKHVETQFVRLWRTKKEGNSSKLQFYKGVSHDYSLQPYLLLTQEHRQAMSKLRISAHDLEIEKGRYTGTPREERLCRNCGVVEDELHFLDSCTMYAHLRQQLLPNTSTGSDEIRVSSLFTDSDIQRQLAKYVYDCFQLRRCNASSDCPQ